MNKKKVFVLIGSRRKKGNTMSFVKSITEKLNQEEIEVEYGFPQDYPLDPCVGCNTCFSKCKCIANDKLEELQNKILQSDLFIIASPVYLHYFSADMKLFLDKCSWWAHTLRMQGKPVVVLSTCNSNGHMTVIKALSEIMAFMGGNVIATANASEVPNQIDNPKWLEEVSREIANRIQKYINLPPQTNFEIEKVFTTGKNLAFYQAEVSRELGIEQHEYLFWKNSGMLSCDSFREHLERKSAKEAS